MSFENSTGRRPVPSQCDAISSEMGSLRPGLRRATAGRFTLSIPSILERKLRLGQPGSRMSLPARACEDDSERKVTDKVAKRREQRYRRIQELRARGLTDGQIRSRMNVYSGKPWPKSEQKWFERVLRDGTQ
jgi:hypothetical protein